MSQQKRQLTSYEEVGIPGVLTPAERWTFFADSYHDSEGGKRFLRERGDWFKPVGVLEGALTMPEALRKRSELLPMTSIVLSMFGELNNLTREGTVSIRLPVQKKDDGTIDESVIEIKQPPIVVVVRQEGDYIVAASEEGKAIPLTDKFFMYNREWGAPNPFEGNFPGEGRPPSPETNLPRS